VHESIEEGGTEREAKKRGKWKNRGGRRRKGKGKPAAPLF